MTERQTYLRRDVLAEPLVDEWYAWTHLVSPVTLAMNIANRHVKIMSSYLRSPQTHQEAALTPALLGGPFMNYATDRSDDVRALLESTCARRAAALELADAVTSLDHLLRKSAAGQSLERLYPLVPRPLQGYVELVYDLNHQAAFRLIEPLLYSSPYHDVSGQSVVLSSSPTEERPFVMSTPRLPEPNQLSLRLAFSDRRLDLLFSSQAFPSVAALGDVLGVQGEDGLPLLAALTTSEAPTPRRRFDGIGVRWRYFGHACVCIETARFTFLIDPSASHASLNDPPRFSYDDLPEHIDFVLLTHNHQDHVLLESLLRLRQRIGCILVPRNSEGALQDPSLRLALESMGFADVREFGALEALDFAGGSVTALPFLGEHGDLDVRSKTAWLLTLEGRHILFAADSNNIAPRMYEHLHRAVGDIDILFIGMECHGAPYSWVYGPLHTRDIERDHDQGRRLSGSNFEAAAAIVDQMKCREVYVYAMGQEPWLNHIMALKYADDSPPIVESDKLLRHCRGRGLVAERLFATKEAWLPP